MFFRSQSETSHSSSRMSALMEVKAGLGRWSHAVPWWNKRLLTVLECSSDQVTVKLNVERMPVPWQLGEILPSTMSDSCNTYKSIYSDSSRSLVILGQWMNQVSSTLGTFTLLQFILFKKEINTFIQQGSLHWSIVTLKTCIMVQIKSISSCSFEVSIHQRILNISQHSWF